MAHSLASAPLLAKNTFPPPPISRSRVSPLPRPGSVPKRLEVWSNVRGRLAHGVGDGGMGMAERGHRKPGKKIDVTAPLRRPTGKSPFAPGSAKRDAARGPR